MKFEKYARRNLKIKCYEKEYRLIYLEDLPKEVDYMAKEIVLKNWHEPAIVDDKNFEWLNQYEWEAIELENGLHAARLVPMGDGTYSWVLMEDMIMGLDY